MTRSNPTLLGGWMRFLLAWAGDRKRLFLEPVYSLKLGEWSGSKNGLITSDRKFCLEKAICILPPVPTGMLFKCCTQRSTATASPICTMAVPSLVFKNLICKEGMGGVKIIVKSHIFAIIVATHKWRWSPATFTSAQFNYVPQLSGTMKFIPDSHTLCVYRPAQGWLGLIEFSCRCHLSHLTQYFMGGERSSAFSFNSI